MVKRAALALFLATITLAGTTSVAGAATPDPMDWWGYYAAGPTDEAPDPGRFLREGRAEEYGTNIVLLRVDETGETLPALHDALADARSRGIRVVLNWHDVLYKGCGSIWNPPKYDETDYGRWREVMERAAIVLADVDDAIVAMLGFDDLNRRPYCFRPASNAASPVQESMRMLEENFPAVALRGHVWQIKDWQPVDGRAEFLPGSTMLFPYSYQRENAANEIGTPFCPHEGTFPKRNLPVESNAARTIADIDDFVAFTNANRAARVPIMFIPSSTHFLFYAAPDIDRGIGCTLETLWYYTRCQAVASGQPWSQRIAGFMAFNYFSNPAPGTWQWTGVEDSPQLQESGRWIGANRTCSYRSSADFRAETTQGHRGWRYQFCATNRAKTVVRNCRDLQTFDAATRGGAWWGTAKNALVWDTGESPPATNGRVTSRTWTAPAAGHVKVSATIVDAVATTACNTTDDGASVAIFTGDKTRVWPATDSWYVVDATTPSATVDLELDVARGTPIRFVVHRNGRDATCDAVRIVADVDVEW